jgi:hypothetical protein
MKNYQKRIDIMGIRIHKCLGYGLDDIEFDTVNFTFIDKRINKNGYLNSNEGHFSLGGFLDFYRENGDNLMYGIDKDLLSNNDWKAYKSIVYDWEFGIKNILLIIPPCHAETWFRYDDIIDYIEETFIQEQTNRYKVFDRGIYPYDGWMNKSTGESISFQYVVAIRREERLLKKTYDIDNLLYIQKGLESLSKKIGFKDYYEAKDNIVPYIPEDVVLLCKYLQLFNEHKTIFELKPMLYVYWG